MKITRTLPLSDLAERMGDTATDDEARKMRDILVERGFEGQETPDIPDSEWESMVMLAQGTWKSAADDLADHRDEASYDDEGPI